MASQRELSTVARVVKFLYVKNAMFVGMLQMYNKEFVVQYTFYFHFFILHITIKLTKEFISVC